MQHGILPVLAMSFCLALSSSALASGAENTATIGIATANIAWEKPQDVKATFAEIAKAGFTTVRIGFKNPVESSYAAMVAAKEAGLDPEKPPKTWPEVTLAAAKLKAAGHKCPFTTAWQGWTQLESFSAWHNVELATKRNGLGGMDARLVGNSPLHVRHIENLANMAQQGLFVYKGRNNSADATFVSGECAMVTGSSALYGAVKRNAKFTGGIGALPYYPDVPGAPQNTVIGGASLWVMAGKKAPEYKGVAAFFNFISSPEVQAASHQRTGYLPITTAAFKLTDSSGFYKK